MSDMGFRLRLKRIRLVLKKDYCIPKGATVIGNVWAVGRDPEYFPDPEKFDPKKWLTAEGKLRDDLKSYPFGFGRRCVMP
jgi:cytochrome P450